MQVSSTYRYAKISAFKAREVTRAIQGLPVSAALDLVAFSPKKAAVLVSKTLKSAVEVCDEKVVLFVHDKAHLDEEDIANAFLVVYGRSKALALNRFGPRSFFTPGPLSGKRVAVLEREPDGTLALAMFNPETGEPAGHETLVTRRSRVVVQS